MKEEPKIHKIPSPVDFMLHTPLYQTFNVIGKFPKQIEEVFNLIYFNGTLDCYCVGCGEKATFKGIPPKRPPANPFDTQATKLPLGTFEVQIQCTRNSSHIYYFMFIVDSRIHDRGTAANDDPIIIFNTITKIGQFPSYSDIVSESILKYRKLLGKELYPELSRAIKLFSSDIGAGSFVYLRRIFESLIEEARQEAAKQDGWNEEKYIRFRMDEKIGELKNYLPSFLYENRIMYAILSKGIHELSENECLTHFEVVKTGIELILDEKIEQIEKNKKIENAKKAIHEVHQSMKPK